MKESLSPKDQFPPVHNQNFFHLAAIQSAGIGLSVVMLGDQLTRKYGAGVAIPSLLIGNLVLWLIGMTIISMVLDYRINAIQNVKDYLGKYGGMLTALLLLFAFLNWFVHQIHTSTTSLATLFHLELPQKRELLIRIGAVLGCLSALLAIGGIRLLKWAAVIALPLLMLYHFYAMFISSASISPPLELGCSFVGVISAILILLPGVINLPTFFRHSLSRADSYLALTVMMFLISFFQVTSIWIQFTQPAIHSALFSWTTAGYIVLTLVLVNLLNIYFASAAWETFIPRFEGAKGHAIIGLLGTAVYTFIQVSSPVYFFEDLANAYIATLGVVMLISFLVRTIVRHRPRTFEKLINGTCWLFGCVVATVMEMKSLGNGVNALLGGVGASSLFFLVVIFVEETVWSAKRIWRKPE
ncbi:MAG: hypothetical protein KGJ02_04360 [Verrucomicrobiota bacterium]|nr:hypothetical protein [Verrucomicrobiota bacterium]